MSNLWKRVTQTGRQWCQKLKQQLPITGRIRIITLVIVVVAIVALTGVVVLAGGNKKKGDTTNFGLKNIGQLATQAALYTNVQLISDAQNLWGWEIPFTQNKYVFSYDGVIKAGIDFASVEVSVNERTHTITVRVPEVIILSNEIDENSLKIYDETQNIFTPLSLTNVTQARSQMKQEAQETAIANGLMENARSNAETLLRGILAGRYSEEKYTFVFEYPHP